MKYIAERWRKCELKCAINNEKLEIKLVDIVS